MYVTFFLLGILLLSLVLRVVGLEDFPRTLYSDEASFLINSVSLKETLRDEDNRFLPVYLHSIKDPKPALYSYLQIPFLQIFGVNTFASRLPAILFGVVSIYLLYRLVEFCTKNRTLALLTAGFLAVSPWHIVMSRSTQEVIMAFCFGIGALWSFLYLLKNDIHIRKKYLFVAVFMILNVLAMYSYHSYKIYLSALYVLLLGHYYVTNRNRIHFPYLATLVLGVAIPFFLTAGGAFTRFSAIGLFSYDLPKAQIFDFISHSTGSTPELLLRMFFNKPVFYFRLFLENYFQHFSGDFFFIQGGETARYRVPAHGWFYYVDAVLLTLGLYLLASKKKYKQLIFLVFALLVTAPLAAALTTEAVPSSDRAFQLVLPLSLLLGLGLLWIIKQTNKVMKWSLLLVVGLGYMWGVSFFLHQFFVVMPTWQAWERSRDYEVLAQNLKLEEDTFDSILVSNDLRELYIYLWLEDALSLSDIRKQPLARYKDSYSLGKYTFNRQHCDFTQADDATLLAGTMKCLTEPKLDLWLYKQTFFDDSNPAYSLYLLPSATMSGELIRPERNN